nr:hypothetical protein [Tanacetum cinerariifolium]
MEDLKQQYLDEMKRLINSEYRDEIKIAELKENFNGMSIEIRKKEKLQQLDQWANLSTCPLKRFNSFCYDDDEDYTIAVTPSLPTEEPVNSLNQFEDFSDSNDEFSSTDDDSFSIDNIDYVEASPPDSELVSLEVMDIVIPEVGGIDDDILLTIKDDILLEKLLNANLFIAKIKALNDNPTLFSDPIVSATSLTLTPFGESDFFLDLFRREGDILLLEAFLNDDPSSDFKTKSSSTSLNSLLEETNTFDNFLPEFETFCFDVKEISSGSTTTHFDSPLYESFIFDLLINPFPPADRSDFYEFADELIHFISTPEYDCFLFKTEPNSGDFTMDVVEDISLTREPRVHNALPTHPTLQLNMKFQPSSESLFTYVVWIFLSFLVYLVAPQYLLSLRNEDTIFDPGISNYHIFLGRMYLIGVELSQDSTSCMKGRWRFSLPLSLSWTNEFGVESGSRLG